MYRPHIEGAAQARYYEKKKDNGHHSVPHIHHRFLLYDDIPAFVDGGLFVQGKQRDIRESKEHIAYEVDH